MTTLQEIQAQIALLQKQAQEIVEAERQPIIEKIKEEIKTYSITAKELGFKDSFKPTEVDVKEKAPVPIKYRLGDKTWSGRGRTPAWILEYEANGGKREELRV